MTANEPSASSLSRRSTSLRVSFSSISSRNLSSAFGLSGRDVFQRNGKLCEDEQDELILAAIERLPTFSATNAEERGADFAGIGIQAKREFQESSNKICEDDNGRFLRVLRDRAQRVGIHIPKVEVRYEHLTVEGDADLGSRVLPTLSNSALNVVEGVFEKLRILPSRKRCVRILNNVSGIIKPSRLTLLLGPPGAGKSVFLKALAGKLEEDLRVSGRVTYCGHEFSEFIPQKACSYISQYDLHHGEMTVRETLNFSARCLGVGSQYKILKELLRREKEAGIEHDPEIEAFSSAIAEDGRDFGVIIDHTLKHLGLDICGDILVGDEMRRGISGGQKKRLTTGEMLVGPAKVFCMDDISTGLDSSTTFQIIKYMRQMVHIMDMTMVISLLQPAPELFELFHDIILISEGNVVYHGPRENILPFFKSAGFMCPDRKGVTDFLQEVISVKDQEQYWSRKEKPYSYVSVSDFADHFSSSNVGHTLFDELAVPYDKNKAHPAALVTEKYGISNMELFMACLSREYLLMKRNSIVYIFKIFQVTVMSIITFSVFFRSKMKVGRLEDGGKFYGALFFSLITLMFNGTTELGLTVLRLPVFFKQRDALFFPAWAFSLPICLLRIPISFIESFIWMVLTYYTIGFAPDPGRFLRQFLAFFALHQMALSLFRLLSAIGRTIIVSFALSTFTLLIVFVLGGFIISKDDIDAWMLWGYYLSPMTYGQNAISINEFLDKRWSAPNTDPRLSEPTIGKALLRMRGMFTEEYMYWVCVAALFAFSIVFNIGFVIALTYLNPFGTTKSTAVDKESKLEKKIVVPTPTEIVNFKVCAVEDEEMSCCTKKGMVLPFTPLSLVFNHVSYYVDIPIEMKKKGVQENRLQLLRDVSGVFRPGILTSLVGVSGAGKTTLMDVLAGRKTGGYIEGSISISGFPKNQTTFARISGYCEQTDIHSPHVTVYESIVYSAWLRLSPEINKESRRMFVEEVMKLIELQPLRNSVVGLPGVNGLSIEQRKRLTIAVELVANPSIIFMDEPTSGLDARAAAIVMRTVRNTVDTGRTVVCTIHQPSIDIFEAFDELLLLKRGGRMIYAGPLGHNSRQLIDYFQSVTGIPRIEKGANPSTWMLDISTPAMEEQLGIDYAEIYANSDLYRKNQELIKQLSTPATGSQDLHFASQYAQSFLSQCRACFWKQNLSYWRNPQYNVVRFFLTTIIGLVFGVTFWKRGDKIHKLQDLMNVIGAMYAAVNFLGGMNTYAVQSVVEIERTAFYREKAAGMYSALPYAFAQVAIETIYTGVQTFIYSFLLYTMMGFELRVDKFFNFYFYVFMCFLYFTAYGMMLVALTPNCHIAAVVMTFILSFWNLFSGFLIPRPQIPIWWRWYYWANPASWTIYGLITSQVGDSGGTIEVPGYGNIPLKDLLHYYLGFDYSFLGFVALAHVAWAIFFCVVFALGIKFLVFQRR